MQRTSCSFVGLTVAATTAGIGTETPRTSARMPIALSTCASVMTSGGTNLSVLSSGAFRIRPLSKHLATTSLAIGFERAAPTIRPAPRTSLIGSPRALSKSTKCFPTLLTFPSTSWCSMVSRTASPAAHINGFPPNVVPWSPGTSIVAALPLATHAPIGMPPPRPLANVMMSG